MSDAESHWSKVWDDSEPDEVSWFQPEPSVSLELVRGLGLPRSARIVDVGGGASRLVDHLLAEGYRDVTVLDVAEAALAKARDRLGPDAETVDWIVGDVREAGLDPAFDLWHDRAVFHFLTSEGDRERYVRQLEAALADGGYAILATFSPEGPERCSGLPVRRYDAEALSAEVGEAFALVDQRREQHATPWDTVQSFQYAVFEHRA